MANISAELIGHGIPRVTLDEDRAPMAAEAAKDLSALLRTWYSLHPEYRAAGKTEAVTFVLLGADAPSALAAVSETS
jgi:hypothetical protein